MDIALIGYGKMGHAIEEAALAKGHRIACTVDNDEEWNAKKETVGRADAAIEFTMPSTAAANIVRCLELGVPVVCGTTGWYDKYDKVAERCRETNGALITATNFSIGVNIMFAINEQLARLMKSHPEYSIYISETHHIHKLDAPSGTAISLRDQITEEYGNGVEIPIASYREGEVPGTHTVRYHSDIDTITLTHEAHSRKGLALGALMAAEWIQGRHGVFTMKDLLKQE